MIRSHLVIVSFIIYTIKFSFNMYFHVLYPYLSIGKAMYYVQATLKNYYVIIL